MKYAKQPDDVSCGPVAILNALKWAGFPATLSDHLPVLQFSCQTFDREKPQDMDAQGTTDFDFDRVLRYAGKNLFRVKRQMRPTIQEIVAHLKNEEGIALSYDWFFKKQFEGHFIFLSGFQNGYIKSVNDHLLKNDSVALRRPKTIEKWLLNNNHNSVAWFLSKS